MKSSAVIIADNSWLIRRGLGQCIEDIDVKASIYECDDLDQLKDKLSVFYIHYVFLNPAILKDDYSSLLELKTDYPSMVIVGMMTEESHRYNKLFDHILPVMAGKSEIRKNLGEIFKQRAGKSSNTSSGLSEREKSILTLVARGRTNQEIADELFISTHTVISHRKNITRKLGIKTVAGLAVYAVINNLADANDLK